jgi:DNA-binding winged helix-turn-helix (wHTH) protein
MSDVIARGQAQGHLFRAGRRLQRAVLALVSAASAVPMLDELAHLGLVCLTCFDPATLLDSVTACDADAVIVHARFAGEQLPHLVSRVRGMSVQTVVVFGAAGNEQQQVREADVLLASELPSYTELAPWLGRQSAREVLERSTWGPLLLDRRSRRGFWMGREINLTCQQFRLLWQLCQAAGAVVTMRELADAVYDGRVGDDRMRIMGHVRRIRRLLEPDPAHPAFLLTVRGEGLRLAGQDELARPQRHALRA